MFLTDMFPHLPTASRGYSLSGLVFDTLTDKWERNKSPWTSVQSPRVLEQDSVTSHQAHTVIMLHAAKHATTSPAAVELARVFQPHRVTAASALERTTE